MAEGQGPLRLKHTAGGPACHEPISRSLSASLCATSTASWCTRLGRRTTRLDTRSSNPRPNRQTSAPSTLNSPRSGRLTSSHRGRFAPMASSRDAAPSVAGFAMPQGMTGTLAWHSIAMRRRSVMPEPTVPMGMTFHDSLEAAGKAPGNGASSHRGASTMVSRSGGRGQARRGRPTIVATGNAAVKAAPHARIRRIWRKFPRTGKCGKSVSGYNHRLVPRVEHFVGIDRDFKSET
jgi:hypothetical protein